jgi:glycine betaine/proline transport system substrate-binding protein
MEKFSMRSKIIKLLAIASLAVGLVACNKPVETAATESCGRVTVGLMSWQSAEFMAHVDREIMTHGYQCTVELIPGDTMTILPPMIEKQQPDIAPEAWVNALKVQIEGAVASGKLHYAGRAYQDGATEGWYVPQYVLDKNPEIKTIGDALARPELFGSPEHPNKGVVHNCPPGWGCNISMRQLFKAFDAEKKGFVLAEVGSSAGLDSSIARAYERKLGWIGYYQAPTAYVAKYNLVKLDAGVAHNSDAWNNCNTKLDCKTPEKNDFAPGTVISVVTDEFVKRGGPVIDYVKTRGYTDEILSDVLVYMDEKQASGEIAAKYFLKKYPEVWTKWVTPSAAEKIKSTL